MAEQDKKYEVEEQNFDDLSAYLKNAMDDAEDYIHQVGEERAESNII